MASINKPLDEENNDQNQLQAPQVSGIQGGATVGATSASAPQGTKSGRFTNISNYLKANAGYNAPQGGLAGKITGNIQNQAQQAGQKLQEAKSQFGEQSQAGRTQLDQGTLTNALKDPNQFVQNQEDVNKFQKMLNAKYSGPQALQNSGTLQSQAKDLQNLTGQTSTEAGRFGLLRQMFNKPTYTSGQQRLDQLLLQGNQGQLGKLSGSRQIGRQAVSQTEAAAQQAQQQAQQFGNEAQQTAKQTGESLTGEQKSQNAILESQRGIQEGKKNTLIDRLTGSLGSRTFSPEDLQTLGLTEGQKTYGLNLGNYFRTSPTEATLQTTMTPEQAMRMNALSKLSGTEASQYNPEDVGSFGKDQYSFNQAQLSNDISAQKAAYEREFQQRMLDQKAKILASVGDQGDGTYGIYRGNIDDMMAEYANKTLNPILNKKYGLDQTIKRS